MAKNQGNNKESKGAESSKKVDASSQTDDCSPWSSWELSTEGNFYYRARVGLSGEWEYDYQYFGMEKSNPAAEESSRATARYLSHTPYEYPQDEFKAVYAKSPEPTYITGAPSLLKFNATEGESTNQHSDTLGIGHDRTTSTQKESSGPSNEAEGQRGTEKEKSADEAIEAQPREKKDKGKKDKTRKPLRKTPHIEEWRDNVNDATQEEHLHFGKKDRKRHGEKRK